MAKGKSNQNEKPDSAATISDAPAPTPPAPTPPAPPEDPPLDDIGLGAGEGEAGEAGGSGEGDGAGSTQDAGPSTQDSTTPPADASPPDATTPDVPPPDAATPSEEALIDIVATLNAELASLSDSKLMMQVVNDALRDLAPDDPELGHRIVSLVIAGMGDPVARMRAVGERYGEAIEARRRAIDAAEKAMAEAFQARSTASERCNMIELPLLHEMQRLSDKLERAITTRRRQDQVAAEIKARATTAGTAA